MIIMMVYNCLFSLFLRSSACNRLKRYSSVYFSPLIVEAMIFSMSVKVMVSGVREAIASYKRRSFSRRAALLRRAPSARLKAASRSSTLLRTLL